MCELQGVERKCVCNAECREALCLNCTVYRVAVCAAKCRELLCVNCTMKSYCV